MTKFFSQKHRKKSSLSRSQQVGLVWFSGGLLIIALLSFFLPRCSSFQDKNAVPDTSDVQKLLLREDSLRTARRSASHRQRSTYPPPSPRAATHPYPAELPPDPPATRQPLRIDLNSADTLTLQLLRGIGPVRAERIVRYRDRLGGFHSVNQLLEVRGISPELLADLAPSLLVNSLNLRPISINSASLKELVRHPYIEYYQARDIVVLRRSGVSFGCADDLRAVPSMADSTLRRLLPYLDFSLPAPTPPEADFPPADSTAQ